MKNILKYILFDTKNSLSNRYNLQSYIEILLISIIIPILGILINPSDIFFLDAPFPWIILPPLLIALRYGTVNGMISLFLIAISILFYISLKGGNLSQFPLHIVSGMIILSLVTGEIIESWKKRFKAQSEEKKYMSERLQQLDNAYRILQVSHGQLEDQFVDKTLSLRKSLELIQTDIDPKSHSPLNLIAKKMLEVLTQFEWLEIAAVYAIDDKIGIIERPLVSQGKMPMLIANDDLLNRALKTKKVISIKKSSYLDHPNKINSNLVAVVPIIDAQQKMWGILAIKQMQFTEFHQQNINVLGLIGNYIANLLSGMKIATKHSHWKQAFTEIDSALKLIMHHNVDAHLLAFSFPNSAKQKDYCQFIESLSSGLNQRWQIEDSNLRLLILMPISNPKENQQHLRNLQIQFKNEFGQTFKHIGIRIQSMYFDHYDNIKPLAEMLRKVRQT